MNDKIPPHFGKTYYSHRIACEREHTVRDKSIGTFWTKRSNQSIHGKRFRSQYWLTISIPVEYRVQWSLMTHPYRSTESCEGHKSMSTYPHFEEVDLENIRNYEYKSGKYTPIDNVLRIITGKTLPYVPKWISPNGITLFGFVMDVLGVVLLCVLKEEDGSASHYACLMYAILASIYMYMDMLDGKQARRLGCNSPIGQLFDHGCDSINGSCLIFAAMKAIGVPNGRAMGLMFGLVGYVFLTFQIIEYFQGVLMFGTPLAGVTEVEIVVVTLNLISFFKGVAFWGTPISSILSAYPYAHTLRDVVEFIIIFAMTGVITIKNLMVVVKGSSLDEKLVGNKNNSRISHILRFVPILFALLCAFMCRTIAGMVTFLSGTYVMERYCYALLCSCSSFALTCSHHCPLHFPLFHYGQHPPHLQEATEL